MSPKATRPFGQPSIDEWLHWVHIRSTNDVAVRYRGQWYTVGWTLFDYMVGRAGSKLSVAFERLPTIRYAEIPWQFQRDVDQWKGLLLSELQGVKHGTPKREVKGESP